MEDGEFAQRLREPRMTCCEMLPSALSGPRTLGELYLS
jgi:hypothetical protein